MFDTIAAELTSKRINCALADVGKATVMQQSDEAARERETEAAKASRKAQSERDKANPTNPGKENRRRAAERQARRAERKAKLADAWYANVARDKAKQAAAAKAARHAIDRSRLLSLLRHRHKAGGCISSWAMWSLEKYRVRVFLHARREKEQVSPSAPVSYSFRSSIRFASLCQAWQAIRSWRVISGGMLRQMRFRVPSMAGDQGGVLRQMRFRPPSMASDQPGMLHARSACSLHAPCPSKHPSTPLLTPVSPPVSHRHPCHANSHHPTPAIPTATILASAVSTATLPSRTCSSFWW